MTALAPTPETVPEARVGSGLFEPRALLTSLPEALRKLDPRVMWRNPVMFVVLVGAVLTTVSAIAEPSVFAWWASWSTLNSSARRGGSARFGRVLLCRAIQRCKNMGRIDLPSIS